MTTTTYVITSLLWALGGLILGFVLGRATRQLDEIRRKVTMDNPTEAATPIERHRTRVERTFGVVLVVLSVLSVIGVGIQTYRLNHITSCQAAYNQRYTEALQQRSDAAATERQAQRDLLTFLLQPHTPEAGREATKRYLDSLAKADHERENAPIPDRGC